MKCIYCGEIIQKDIIKCPICGKYTHMVPDYSIYDDDNIHVLLEGAQQISNAKETADANRKKKNRLEDPRDYGSSRVAGAACVDASLGR